MPQIPQVDRPRAAGLKNADGVGAAQRALLPVVERFHRLYSKRAVRLGQNLRAVNGVVVGVLVAAIYFVDGHLGVRLRQGRIALHAGV